MRVGADARIGERQVFTINVASVNDLREVLDVDLVNDSRSGRNHLEIVECRLTPAKELVALAVSLIFNLDVAFESVFAAKKVGNDRVVDDQFSGSERVNFFGVSAQFCHSFAHGCKVDDARNTREILHHHSGWSELDFGVRFGVRIPVSEGTNLISGDIGAIFGAKKVLEKNLQTVREPVGTVDRVEPKKRVVAALHGQGGLGTERINAHSKLLLTRDNSPILIPRAMPSGQRRTARIASSATSATTAPHRAGRP